MNKFFNLNKKEKDKIIDKIKSILLIDDNIEFSYIFGSFIQDNFFRDIDIGIYLKNINENEVFDYEFKISNEISLKCKIDIELIDVRVLNFAPFPFLVNVFKDGILLFTKDEKFLTDLIEKTSLYAVSNEHISYQSLKELLDI
ncbi:MAG TPA: nucleotidyltransferase domain-containing protein [Caldisericia bacterium]|nr:nucleotidyltransferase domain-containing protein [Caldisericia bacterium]HPC57212.1 nucleotidyltransferase domain-containing protein [Caldisericia bacterium]HRT36739.1 nucleotidyltransferase domain-containing protein [Caldisericia bacterium]